MRANAGTRPYGSSSAWNTWLDRIGQAALVVGLGVLIGMQYMAPDKRVLSVIAGLLVAGVAWRLDIVSGVGVAIIALPFPKGTTFGTTNLALILLLVVIYLLRFALREIPRPRPTQLDMPILGLFLAYVVSFYNVAAGDVGQAVANFELFVGTLLMFFVIVNCVRTEADLRRIHGFQTVALALIILLAVWELTHPGSAIVPGWIDFSHTLGEVFDTRNVRIGGAFYDYELFAEFCGLNIIFLLFLLSHAQTVWRRVMLGGLLMLTTLMMFSTVTRGPIISLGVSLLYLLWEMRRRLKVVPMTIGAAAITAVFLGSNFFISTFTRSGNLFARLGQTEIKGFVPDTRAAAWVNAWEHFLIHPIIGSGPYYSSSHGLYFWYWPHCLYLYVANIVGVIGLAFMLWLIWKLFMATQPRVDSPNHPDYVESYLLIARVQCVFFFVDQIKIEYLRNATYQYQVWLLFALWIAADRLRRTPGRVIGAPGA